MNEKCEYTEKHVRSKIQIGVMIGSPCYCIKNTFRPATVLCREVVLFSEVQVNCISTVERELFGAGNSVLCSKDCPLSECSLSEVPL